MLYLWVWFQSFGFQQFCNVGFARQGNTDGFAWLIFYYKDEFDVRRSKSFTADTQDECMKRASASRSYFPLKQSETALA